MTTRIETGRVGRLRLPLATAVLLLSFLPMVSGGAEDEERPKIFLEKRVYSTEISEGKKAFFEPHTVVEGENLWKILNRKGPLAPEQYAAQVREFRRVNPKVANTDRLVPGQEVRVPLPPPAPGEAKAAEGKASPHRVRKGESLIRILRAGGVKSREMSRYLDAVKAINPTVKNVDRILAGSTLFLPTASYFRTDDLPVQTALAAESVKPDSPVQTAKDAAVEPRPTQPAPTQEAPDPAPKEEPATALTREAPEEKGSTELATAKPEAQLKVPATAQEAAASTVTGSVVKAAGGEPPAPEKPPYRGLLSDLVSALGERWMDRGTLYLPVPSGGEVVLDMGEFPVVRFGTGRSVLIDFKGSLSPDIRALVSETWKEYRLVTMEGSPGPVEMIERLIAASGYSSVKEGTSRPMVIGESVAVTLPARWVIFRTRQSQEAGDVILVKEVPEKIPGNLDAVLTYAGRIGIRVLPISWDAGAREGFLAGLSERKGPDAPEPRWLPGSGLPALDAGLKIAGIPSETEPTLKMSGKDEAFRLTVRPERVFTVGGKKYVVDAGRITPAIRSLLKGAGYELFEVPKGESGKMTFLRILKIAGVSYEERRGFRVAGGPGEGYDLHLTGTFITSKELLESRKVRAMVVIRGKIHAATRALLKELGVEIIEWTS